jgi:SAM-dependent methyltransferase
MRGLKMDGQRDAGRCDRCGLMRFGLSPERRGREHMIHHYRHVDPHEAVAASKSPFFRSALDELNALVDRRPRTLLDVGCSFGHFLKMAAFRGWRVRGVEILPEGVRAARRRVPDAVVFEGDLREARMAGGFLDAVTLWDVLDHLEDPGAMLAECHRILAPGGVLAIRVRNAECQFRIYRFYSCARGFWQRLGVKPLFAFHRFGFSLAALERLLKHTGYQIIATRNSPLTRGEPYQDPSMRAAFRGAKLILGAVSEGLYRLTAGRALIGPSLLVYARRP